MATKTDDDVQVVLSDNSEAQAEKAIGLVHIIDPQCRNLRFGDGPREQQIELRPIYPSDWPQDVPDELKVKYPGEAMVVPDHPALDSFRTWHGDHATIRELTRPADKVKPESIQGAQKPKR